MSQPQQNNPYAAAEDMAAHLLEVAEQAVRNDEQGMISDAAVRRIMTAAVRLYAAKALREDRSFRALEGTYDEVVTPTEALTATTEILRALRLGPMEFGLWSRRHPEDYHQRAEQDPGTTEPEEAG